MPRQIMNRHSNIKTKRKNRDQKQFLARSCFFVCGDENISVTEMAESLGVTTRTIKRDIDYLKEMKVVKREGTAKSGKWIISIE